MNEKNVRFSNLSKKVALHTLYLSKLKYVCDKDLKSEVTLHLKLRYILMNHKVVNKPTVEDLDFR